MLGLCGGMEFHAFKYVSFTHSSASSLLPNGESLTSGKFRGEMRTLGSGVGTIDIYTVRDYGHLNSEHHGTLTGIEKYSQEEFDEHTQAGMSGNQPIGNASHN